MQPTVSKPHLILPSEKCHFLSGNCSIGRTHDNQVCLDSENVSRKHAHIYEIAGQFQLVDAQSRNGTYLNSAKVTHPVLLRSGDRIRIVDYELVFVHGPIVAPATEVTGSFDRTMEVVSTVRCWLILADIVKSTDLLSEVGSEPYVLAMGWWFEECRAIIERHGGELNKATGDGFLAYWKEGDATKEREVAKALAELNALRVTLLQLEFRLVVHVGSVSIGGRANLGEESLGGLELHKLFRIEKAWKESGVINLASAEARIGLQSHLGFQELGLLDPKDLPGTHPVFSFTFGSVAS